MKTLAFLSITCLPMLGQTAASLSPPPNLQFFNTSTGASIPCVGCSLYTYSAGTLTPLATYVDYTGTTTNANPIVLDSGGYSPSGIWIKGSCYKFILQDASAVTIWTQDQICDNAQLFKAALAASGGAALVGFLPTSGTVATTVAAALNDAFLLDIGYSTFAAACSAAVGASKTLAVTKAWTALGNQTCAANLMFFTGGSLQPSATRTVTLSGSITAASNLAIFDISLTGKVLGGAPAALLNPVYPAWFGAAVDGVTDELAADNAALAFFGTTATMRSGWLNMCGPHLISSTLLIENKSMVIAGCGWGSSTATPKGSYIKYGGTDATIPLIKVKGSEGLTFKDIRLVGNSSHKPTAAIDYAAGNGIGTSSNQFSNIRIGSYVGLDSDDAEQFQSGILSTGANANVDLTQWDKIYIYKAAICVNIANTQNVNWTFTNLTTVLCSTSGLKTNAPVTLISPSFNNNAIDFTFGAGSGGRVEAFNYISEGGGRLADLTGSGGAAALHMTTGVFNIGVSLNADGKVIVANDNSVNSIVLSDFEFFDDLAESHAPVFDFTHSSGGYLRYVDIGLRKGSTITHSNFLISSITGAGSGDFYNFQAPWENWRIIGGSGWNNDSSFTPNGNEFRMNVLQLQAFTFATLPSWAQLRDGTGVYCSDCKNVLFDSATAGQACVNSGTGSWAKRTAGAWVCN